MMSNLSVLHSSDGRVSLEVDNMKLPKCCGETMRIYMDTGKFVEAVCLHCNDRVYLKKSSIQKPDMIDD